VRINWWRVFPFGVCTLFWLFVILLLVGCACSPQVSTSVPAWLVPNKPTVPTVMAADLTCLSDDTYLRLAERDRTCWQYVSELRALLDAPH
jgi:hypothetical protein